MSHSSACSFCRKSDLCGIPGTWFCIFLVFCFRIPLLSLTFGILIVVLHGLFEFILLWNPPRFPVAGYVVLVWVFGSFGHSFITYIFYPLPFYSIMWTCHRYTGYDPRTALIFKICFPSSAALLGGFHFASSRPLLSVLLCRLALSFLPSMCSFRIVSSFLFFWPHCAV